MKIFLTSQASNVLEHICKRFPKVPDDYSLAFVSTASNPYDNPTWMRKDKDKLEKLGFNLFEIDIEGKTLTELKKLLSNIDIIFVAGGDTFFLLEKVKKSGFDKLLRQLMKKDIVYIGSSAGSVILSPDIEPDKFFDEGNSNLKDTSAIGLIEFFPLPHYNNKNYKALNDKIIKEYKNWKYRIVPLTDTQYIYIKNKEYEVIDVTKQNILKIHFFI